MGRMMLGIACAVKEIRHRPIEYVRIGFHLSGNWLILRLMKNLCAYGAILFGLVGMFSGIADWALSNYVLESVDWEGPLVSIQLMAWVFTYISFGIGIILAGLSSLLKESA